MKRMRAQSLGVGLSTWVTLVALLLAAPSLATGTSFTELSNLGGSYDFNKAYDVSADGSTVVGYAVNTGGNSEAFRAQKNSSGTWVLSGLGTLGSSTFSYARAVSADGSVVVGDSNNQAFRWESSRGIEGLGDLPGASFRSIAWGVSADGYVVVGSGRNDVTVGSTLVDRPEAFRLAWTAGATLSDSDGLGDLPGNEFSSTAFSVSADGSVVVGQGKSGTGFGNTEAFRHDMSSGSTIGAGDGLGDLDNGGFYSTAQAVTSDGSVVVGQSNSSSGPEAFRWTQATGMVGLGGFPKISGSIDSIAYDVSADGNTIVGRSDSTTGDHAFIWTPSSGMVKLSDVLVAQDIDMTGWRLDEAQGISDDGRVIAGWGTKASRTEAWVVELDNLALSLVTGSDAIVSQTVDTPAADFNFMFDYLFQTSTGSLTVELNDNQIAGPLGPVSGWQTFNITLGSPYLNLTDALLEFILTGPSGSQVLIDNIIFPDLENGDFLLSLNSWEPTNGTVGVVALTGEEGSSGDGTEPVPEPATLLLLGSGLAGLGLFRRRKTTRSKEES